MKISDILVVCNISACPARFRQAMSLLLPLECAFESDGVTICTENVAGDSGGRTFAGLDEASHPDFPYHDPTPQAVVAAYEKEWNRLRCCELPPPLGSALFIQATNQGDQRCETMLQEAVNDYGGKIVVDGMIGPGTIRAAWSISATDLTRAFLAKSRTRYRTIVQRSPLLGKFEAGWMNRVATIEKFYELGFDSTRIA